MITVQDVVTALAGVGITLEITGEDQCITELIEDSLHFVSALVQLEQEFQIEFTNDELNEDLFSSLNFLVEKINKKLSA